MRFSQKQLRTLCSYATYLIVNEYEWQLIEKKASLTKESLVNHLQALVITCAQRGVFFYTKKGKGHIPAFSIDKLVDPTGCGDAFRAGFVYGLIQSASLDQCVIMGALMGAVKAGSIGGQNHTITEKNFLESLKR